jgi:hypothetical protein
MPIQSHHRESIFVLDSSSRQVASEHTAPGGVGTCLHRADCRHSCTPLSTVYGALRDAGITPTHTVVPMAK